MFTRIVDSFLSCLLILHPSYLIMVAHYSAAWDKKFKGLMRNNKFVFDPNRPCVAKLGDYNIWIRNYPYACFTCEDVPAGDCVRPSRITIYRAYKKLQKDLFEDKICYDVYRESSI